MALVKCKECGAEISTKADACPRCGAKIKRTSGCAKIVAFLFVLILIPPMLSGFVEGFSSAHRRAAAGGTSTSNMPTNTASTASSTPAPAPTTGSRNTKLEEANERFKQWALKNTAVTDIAIKGPSMFVTLTSDKYTNRDNVRLIAESLSRAYVNQTGESYIVCHVFLGNEEYAKGHN